jgi:hypothetical protein
VTLTAVSPAAPPQPGPPDTLEGGPPPWWVLAERCAALQAAGISRRRVAEEAGVSRGGLGLLLCGAGGSAALQATVRAALDRLERLGAVEWPHAICPNPACGAAYLPRSGNQVWCSPACGDRARKAGLSRLAVAGPLAPGEAAAQLRRVQENLRVAQAAAVPQRSGLPVAPGHEAGWYWATAPAQPTRECDLCGTHYRGAPAWRHGSVAACAAHDAWDVARWCAVHPSAVAGRGGFGE